MLFTLAIRPERSEVEGDVPPPFDFGDKAAYAQGERCLYFFVPDQ